MPDRHQFRKLVDSTGLLERAAEWRARTGTDWPHGMDDAWRWSIRDVTAGQDVAAGHASSYEEADRQAQGALETAEDVEAERFQAELGA